MIWSRILGLKSCFCFVLFSFLLLTFLFFFPAHLASLCSGILLSCLFFSFSFFPVTSSLVFGSPQCAVQGHVFITFADSPLECPVGQSVGTIAEQMG